MRTVVAHRDKGVVPSFPKPHARSPNERRRPTPDAPIGVSPVTLGRMTCFSAAAPDVRIAPPVAEESSTLIFALAELQHELDVLHFSSSISCLLRHLHVAK
eukprot:14618240-Heterocapsa_arctica.AAC.1